MSTRLPLALGLVIALIAVVSGPLVGAVDLTRSAPPQQGAGTADLTVESIPEDDLRLERGRFGAGRYHLAGRPAVIAVDNVTGDPVLRYSIDIAALSFTVTTEYDLAAVRGETLRLRHKPIGVSPARVDQEHYEGTIAIWVRSGDLYDRLVQERIEIEVVE